MRLVGGGERDGMVPRYTSDGIVQPVLGEEGLLPDSRASSMTTAGCDLDGDWRR